MINTNTIPHNRHFESMLNLLCEIHTVFLMQITPPLKESEMIQESRKTLENYRNNGISQNAVEIWANNLGKRPK
jgi:hypothetical protein